MTSETTEELMEIRIQLERIANSLDTKTCNRLSVDGDAKLDKLSCMQDKNQDSLLSKEDREKADKYVKETISNLIKEVIMKDYGK